MGKAKFDGYAQEYDIWFMTNENVFLSELKLLKAALDLTDGGRILSVGCGSGLFEKALNDEYGITVTDGVEPSEDMSGIARKRGMQVQIATAETAQLEPESYDVIYFNGSSSYIPNLDVAYGNILKALKTGGKLVLLDVPKESAYGLLYLLAGKLDTYTAPELLDTAPDCPYRSSWFIPHIGTPPRRSPRFSPSIWDCMTLNTARRSWLIRYTRTVPSRNPSKAIRPVATSPSSPPSKKNDLRGIHDIMWMPRKSFLLDISAYKARTCHSTR